VKTILENGKRNTATFVKGGLIRGKRIQRGGGSPDKRGKGTKSPFKYQKQKKKAIKL